MSEAQKFLPKLPGFFAEHTEKQEDEEALQRGENGEEDLESESHFLYSDGQRSKEPREAKEEHDTCNADHETNDSLAVEGFVLPCHGAFCVLDEDHYHHNVDHNIEEDDSKDRGQECHKENNGIAQETAVRAQIEHGNYHEHRQPGMQV